MSLLFVIKWTQFHYTLLCRDYIPQSSEDYQRQGEGGEREERGWERGRIGGGRRGSRGGGREEWGKERVVD